MMSTLTRTSLRRTNGASPDGIADEELLRCFTARRDEAAERAFAELVRRHGPMVLGLCRHLVRDPHDAEDAFQATFLVLAKKARSIARPERLACWLRGVAVRVARRSRSLDGRRRRVEGRRLARLDADLVGDPGRQDQRLARLEVASAVREELARLPEKYRSPVVLCDLGGLTHAEAAGRLHWPLGSLSVRLMRARDLLRDRLVRRGLAPSAGLLVDSASTWQGSAAVPRGLAEVTVRCALGPASASGCVPGAVAAMAGYALGGLALGKALAAASAILVIGLATLAASMAARGDADLPPLAGGEAGAAPRAPGIAPDRDPKAPTLVEGEGRDGPASDLDDGPRSKAGAASASYHILAGRAGRDADSQVRLALWCESRGLARERLHHLSLAILREPGHPGARALIGQVSYGGRWRRPEDVGEVVRADGTLSAALEAYRARRSKAADTADAHWKLADWCERNGLEAEATAHVRAASRLDPSHELARKRLGFRPVGGRWLAPEQARQALADSAARKSGIQRWRPLLARWRGWLDDPKRRAAAERELGDLVDPLAVPSVWEVFASGGPSDQARAVQLLGQIDSPPSTAALTLLAAFGSAEPDRRAASETIALRDPKDAVAMLVALLRDPDPNPNSIVYRYEFLPVGALGIGVPGVTRVEGRRVNLLRTYTLDESWGMGNFNLDPATDPSGYRGRLASLRAIQLQELEATLAGFLAEAMGEFGQFREAATRLNARVIQTLKNVTKVDRGGSWEDWKRWWVEGVGYAYDPEQFRNPPDLSVFDPKPTIVAQNYHLSCFGAGTPVQTLTGPRPIESIRVGDRVLTQDVEKGGLDYAPVLAVFHNRPAETLRVDLGEGPIVTTGIHRFWVAGKGWTMARDLRPGHPVRTLGGLATVRAVGPHEIRPVYNLEVGRDRTFFAGRPSALVHDNSRVEPVLRPFDAFQDGPAGPGK